MEEEEEINGTEEEVKEEATEDTVDINDEQKVNECNEK